jgi:hypothetical protein
MFEQGNRHFDVWSLQHFKDNTFFERYNSSKLTDFDREFKTIVRNIAPEYNCKYVHTLERYPGIDVYVDIPTMAEAGLVR